MATKKEAENKVIVLPEFKRESAMIELVGEEPLILCCMTKSARQEIIDKFTGKEIPKKKDPINMYEQLVSSLHWMDGEETDYTKEGWMNALKNNRVGYHIEGIKKGMLEAVIRVFGKSKSTVENASISVIPEKKCLVPVTFEGNSYTEDIITSYNGTFLSYKNVFEDWRIKLRVDYLSSNISIDTIVTIFQAMGFAGGLGARRVGLKGCTNGTFHVGEVSVQPFA